MAERLQRQADNYIAQTIGEPALIPQAEQSVDELSRVAVADYDRAGSLRIPPKTGKHEYVGNVILNNEDGSFLLEWTDRNGKVRGIQLHDAAALDADSKRTAQYAENPVIVSYNNGKATVVELTPELAASRERAQKQKGDFVLGD